MEKPPVRQAKAPLLSRTGGAMETLSNITDMTDALSLYFDDNDGEIMNHQ
jgi:hypothetical protein